MYTTKYFLNLYTITEIKKRKWIGCRFHSYDTTERTFNLSYCVLLSGNSCPHYGFTVSYICFTVYVGTNNNIIMSVKSFNIWKRKIHLVMKYKMSLLLHYMVYVYLFILRAVPGFTSVFGGWMGMWGRSHWASFWHSVLSSLYDCLWSASFLQCCPCL